ncbi:MAG: thermonuclease family protein [Pseudonocardiaceae bacterium]
MAIRTVLTILLGVLSAACAAPSPAARGIPPEAQPVVVTRVADGDTIWVRPALGGEEQRVRRLEIDAPETHATRGGPQCYGPEATAFAEEELAVDSTVHLVADREDTDRYGRMLRYVWTDDGEFYNEEAIRQGFARAVLYEPNDRFIGTMRAAEAEARGAERGLWGPSCALP